MTARACTMILAPFKAAAGHDTLARPEGGRLHDGAMCGYGDEPNLIQRMRRITSDTKADSPIHGA